MGWAENRKSVAHLMAVAGLGLSLGACASLTAGSSGGVPDPNRILLEKAQERAAVAQNSVKEATDMIAEGERQRTEGQNLMTEGQKKIDTGRELKAAADIELARAQKQVAAQQAQMPQTSQDQGAQ